jgi:SAM-dependent methyltransferase
MTKEGQYQHAGLYNLKIKLPLIASIRRSEEAAINRLIERYAKPGMRVLEVGPGTGYYTLKLAKLCREVVSIERCPEMTEILRRKIADAGITNVTVTNADFRDAALEGEFDLAISIGVLDYIEDARAFVGKMCAATRQAVILTAPQGGFLGWCFVTSSKLIKVKVYCYDRNDAAGWADGWNCAYVDDVGLKGPLTKGMTLVAALEPAKNQ